MRVTDVFTYNLKAYNDRFRFIVNQGGARSSKTYSILQLLYVIATTTAGLTISVVSESLPHLKKGAIKDFEDILKTEGITPEINLTDRTYFFGTSRIEFFSAEDSGKVTGPSRDILYINECNNVPYSIFDAASLRTIKLIILDFNPTSEFWVHEKLLRERASECAFIKTTYRDNDELPDSIRREIEARRNDASWWRVYGEGEIGSLEGLVFPDWKIVKDVPSGGRVFYGMDFGFTNDPTTLSKVTLHGDDLYIEELMYQTAMTTGDIVRELRSLGITRERINCDSSDPKTIEELRRAGFNVWPAQKGPDSVRVGIDLIKRRKMYVTASSTNAIKELRNYKWRVDRVTGKSLNEPVDAFNHLIDPTRYALEEASERAYRKPTRGVAV